MAAADGTLNRRFGRLSLCLLGPTWSLQGEERQVHFGENFVDPPDLALDTFKFLAWSKSGGRPLAELVDLPFGHADVYYLTKLALALEMDAAP